MNPNVANGLLGFVNGDGFSRAKNKEDEIQAGNNYMMSAPCQVPQFMSLVEVISRIALTTLPTALKGATLVVSNLVAPLVAIPFILISGVVKSEKYDAMADWWNSSKASFPRVIRSISLPANLRPTTIKIYNYSAANLGHILRVAMIVATVALIALGELHFGGALLAGLGYNILDKMGLVPRRVSLFVEKHMPLVTVATFVFAGGLLINRIVAALILPTYIWKSGWQKIAFSKVESLYRKIMQVKVGKSMDLGPTYQEFMAPDVKNRNMTYQEITKILDTPSHQFELNPAHCSTRLNADLPKSYKFEEYMTLFDEIDWESQYSTVRLKFKDDDRFHRFLCGEYKKHFKKEITEGYVKGELNKVIEVLAKEAGMPVESEDGMAFLPSERRSFFVGPFKESLRKKHKEQIGGYNHYSLSTDQLLTALALRNNTTPQRYKEQLFNQHLVDRYNDLGDKKLTVPDLFGHFDEVVDAIAKKQSLTPKQYLAQTLRKQMHTLVDHINSKFGKRIEGDQIDLEDSIESCSQILPHLKNLKQKGSVEARTECGDILLKLGVEGGEYCARALRRASEEIVDGIEAEGNDPARMFEDSLRRALKGKRKKLVERVYNILKQKLPEKIGSDVHGMDLWNVYLSLGFLPMSKNQIDTIDISKFMPWLTYSFIRVPMLDVYKNGHNYTNQHLFGNDPKDKGLSTVLAEVGNQRATDYIRKVISENPKLTPAQKEKLVGQKEVSRMSDGDNFDNLMFVMNGIMRIKK